MSCEHCEDGLICTTGCITKGRKINSNAHRYTSKARPHRRNNYEYHAIHVEEHTGVVDYD